MGFVDDEIALFYIREGLYLLAFSVLSAGFFGAGEDVGLRQVQLFFERELRAGYEAAVLKLDFAFQTDALQKVLEVYVAVRRGAGYLHVIAVLYEAPEVRFQHVHVARIDRSLPRLYVRDVVQHRGIAYLLGERCAPEGSQRRFERVYLFEVFSIGMALKVAQNACRALQGLPRCLLLLLVVKIQDLCDARRVVGHDEGRVREVIEDQAGLLVEVGGEALKVLGVDALLYALDKVVPALGYAAVCG